MSKVLGDNPFGDAPAAKPDADGDDAAKTPARKKSAKPKAEKVEKAAKPEKKAAAPAPAPSSTKTDDDDAWDDAAPDAVPPEEAEVFYGEEAAPPPGDYGPGLDDHEELPYVRKSITEEVRELERRVRARLTPAFPIEHRRKVPFEFLWRRYRDFAMRDRSDVVDEFGRDPLVSAKVEPLLELLFSKWFRVSVDGDQHLPETGRGLLVANHSGTLPYDGAMLMHAVRRHSASRRDVRPLVEDFVFHFPYLGTFINRIGGVRACQENAERLLHDDELVAVFPEGIKGVGKLWKERYRLQRFGRGGFVKLALRTGAPIIPTAVIGAEEIHPLVAKVTWLAKSVGIPYLPITPTFPWLGPLGLVPLPSKWTIRFGAPMDFAGQYGAAAADDRILVNRLSEQVRVKIQEMVDETLAQRRSVLFG